MKRLFLVAGILTACSTTLHEAGAPIAISGAEVPGWLEISRSPGAAEIEGGAAAARHGDWAAAREQLTAALPAVVAQNHLDTTLAAHTLLARACNALHDDACTSREVDAALAAWGDRKTAEGKLAGLGGDAALQKEHAERALQAIGEAIFLFGESKRAEADALKKPALHGPTNRESVLAFIKNEIAPWVGKKRALISAAAKTYERVLDTAKEPAPGWHVECAARAAELWDRFVTDFRDTPMPDEWKGNGPSRSVAATALGPSS